MIPRIRRPPLSSTNLLALIAVFCWACGSTDASAPSLDHPRFITNGVPTGMNFGSVGALLLDFTGDGKPDALTCSGSLIASDVFLLAAHCVSVPGSAGACAGAATLWSVSFAPDLFSPSFPPADAIQAIDCHADPAFDFRSENSHDLAVIILPAGATAGKTPFQLPPAGFLDALAAQGGLHSQLFVNAGYGVDATQSGHPVIFGGGVRKTSQSPFQALQPSWLQLQMNVSATGLGGVCFIDSGSPTLDADGVLIYGVITHGNPNCRSQGYSYRLDTPSARAFLGQYVTLP